MYDASDLSPIVMVEVRTLSFGGSRDAAVCAPTTCAQQELGQQCTWNKSQEWRRGAGQSHWSVKSPIAVCPQPACSVFSVHTPYFIFVSHLQMILSVLILINIVALSLIIVKMILILSSAAMPGCMCCKGAAIFSCTNTDLQSTNTTRKFRKYHSKY